MLALELVMSIPLVIIGIAFVVAMGAFMSPRLARWLEARTVPRWPRTQGWFYDETSVLGHTGADAAPPESLREPAEEAAAPTGEETFGRTD